MDYLKIGTKVKLNSGIEGEIVGTWHDDPSGKPQYGVRFWDNSGSKQINRFYEIDFEILAGG